MTKKIIHSRDFNDTEIKEISRYILTNVPFAALEQVFIFTEKPIDKSSAFVTIYRLINSCYNYVEKKETKTKIKSLIDNCSELYDNIYNLLLKYNENDWGSDFIYDKICNLLSDQKNRILMNNLLDVFLVFVERQTFHSLDKISGIKTDELEGSELVDKLVEIEDD